MAVSFADKLAAAQERNHSQIGLMIAPGLTKMPLPIQHYNHPFLPFGKAIINATHDLVCAYVFDLAAYLAIGAAGAVALERTIAYASSDVITVLHGAFAAVDYTLLWDEGAFNVDAMTFAHLEVAQSVNAKRIDHKGLAVISDQNEAFLVSDDQTLRIRLVEESTLNTGQDDDFAERLRLKIKEILGDKPTGRTIP